MDYPYTKCLNPRRIMNPYTGEHLVVPCGVCPSCSLRKSAMNALKCKLESMSHKYTMFITLTYNNVSLPRMIVKATNRYKDDCGEVCDTYESFSLVDVTQRLKTEGTLLGRTQTYYGLSALSRKVNLPFGVLPHLSKDDVQLFIKRLRKYLTTYFKKTYDKEAPKIRYYAVGEYGPVHFRPHYHLMLWFSSDEIYKIIRQAIYSCWSFGRIDIEKSRGQCADYVAKYLNCTVSLPSLFKECGTRPFSIHSAHLGEKIFEKTRNEIYQTPFKDITRVRIPHISNDTDVILWRSLKNFYFPKCKAYTAKSKYERLFSYKAYARVRDWTKETRVSRQSAILIDWILRLHYHMDDLYLDKCVTPDYEMIDYFHNSARVDLYNLERQDFKEYVEKMYQAIYMELRISKHFHTFVCQGFINKYIPMIEKIDEFWKWNDMQNLNIQYRKMEELGISDWFVNEEDYNFFYFNHGFDVEKFKEHSAYKKWRMMCTKNLDSSVKHKKLNDLNKVFEKL